MVYYIKLIKEAWILSCTAQGPQKAESMVREWAQERPHKYIFDSQQHRDTFACKDHSNYILKDMNTNEGPCY